jgi:UDP-glucose 4-epimerase
MRILVTGGAGYIGSVTTRLLLDHGHQVTVLDSLEHGWRDAVDPRAELVAGDVGDRAALDLALPGCAAVVHLAGLIEVAESQADPERYFEANLTKPKRMLSAMAEHGVDALVFSSTAAVYGEPDSVPITERADTEPVNVYGASKLAFERAIASAGATVGLRSFVFRYFNAAGAWPDGSLGESHRPETHIIPRVLTAMSTGQRTFEVFGADYPTPDGTCVRDYVHVWDISRAHLLAVERLSEGGAGAVVNLGNGRGYSNLEVVRACAEVSGRDVEVVIGPRRAGDPAVLTASRDLADEVLGWRPERGDLRVMVEDAWRWHRGRPAGYGC